MFHTHTPCPCSMFMLYVHSPCLCFMSMLHVHVSMLLVLTACTCGLFARLVHAACQCCLSILHVQAACSCFISMPHVHTAFPYWKPMLHVYVSMLHVPLDVHGAWTRPRKIVFISVFIINISEFYDFLVISRNKIFFGRISRNFFPAKFLEILAQSEDQNCTKFSEISQNFS